MTRASSDPETFADARQNGDPGQPGNGTNRGSLAREAESQPVPGPASAPEGPPSGTGTLRLGLPKGRMAEGVNRLLADAGLDVVSSGRDYRPSLRVEGFEVKILKPQNIVEMLHAGSRDIGFAGADWVAELNAGVVELLDTGLDPVRLVAAAPPSMLDAEGRLRADRSRLLIASEYERLTRLWIAERHLRGAKFVHSYGATEVFPPEDADCIVDNTATGSTLRANNLVIFDQLMRSSTRLYANPHVLEDPTQRTRVETFVTLLRSVLEARQRVLIEINVATDRLARVVEILPCMRQPTIAALNADAGYAVKAAVRRDLLPTLIPLIKERGGTDIVVSQVAQIVP